MTGYCLSMKATIQKRIDELTAQREKALKGVQAEFERQASIIKQELITTHITPIDARLEELTLLLSLADMPLPATVPQEPA